MSRSNIQILSTGRILTCSKLLLLGCLAFLLQACQDSQMTDLRDFVATAYQDKKPEIEPLPAIEPFMAFAYSASEESDPFSAENIISNRDEGGSAQGAAKRPDADRRREDLEQYPLDALRIVGTLTKQNVPWVIVKTSDEKALLASLGNYMGQNDGKIKQIIPDEQKVVLVETVLDQAGRWITRDVEITIDE